MIGDWSVFAPYFTEDEFRCKCGCGKADMDPEFMQDLKAIRKECGFPFIITSGYRCPDHNIEVSSTGPNGPHTTGKAADIAISGAEARLLMDFAVDHFNGFGFKQHGPHSGRFIHLDKLGWRIWSYG